MRRAGAKGFARTRNSCGSIRFEKRQLFELRQGLLDQLPRLGSPIARRCGIDQRCIELAGLDQPEQLAGNRTYIITTRRMTSGEELKHRNGLEGNAPDLRGIRRRYLVRG